MCNNAIKNLCTETSKQYVLYHFIVLTGTGETVGGAGNDIML